MGRKAKYSKELKLEIVKRYLKGKSASIFSPSLIRKCLYVLGSINHLSLAIVPALGTIFIVLEYLYPFNKHNITVITPP